MVPPAIKSRMKAFMASGPQVGLCLVCQSKYPAEWRPDAGGQARLRRISTKPEYLVFMMAQAAKSLFVEISKTEYDYAGIRTRLSNPIARR